MIKYVMTTSKSILDNNNKKFTPKLVRRLALLFTNNLSNIGSSAQKIERLYFGNKAVVLSMAHIL